MSATKVTQSVRASIANETQYGSVIPPIYMSTNFTFEDYNTPRTYDYTRSGNPTRSSLADAISQLEEGAGTVVTSSGLSAVTLLLQPLKLGDEIVVTHDCYGGTWRLLNALAQKEKLKVSFVNLNNKKELSQALTKNPKQVWIETPSNPLLRITDIEDITQQAHAQGAKVVVDNTFLSPILQTPIKLGADYVLHSTTKYINGHSDIVGGCVVSRCQTDHEELRWWANASGLTGAPFDSWLALRGLRTLDLRIRKQEKTAQAIAEFLTTQKNVTNVYYPGLSTHPDHHLAKKQQKGFGAMLSFELQGETSTIRDFLTNRLYFTLAESLGGVESLIAHPATMTHASMSTEARALAGIQDNLIRLSIGIEDTEDLISDLKEGLK